jgi:hypothetical protein
MAETDSAHQKYSGLTIGQKTEVYQQLLLYSVEGRLRYGSITKVAGRHLHPMQPRDIGGGEGKRRYHRNLK